MRHRGSWHPVRFPAMFAVLEHPRHGVVLFDTGYSSRFFAATQPFPERMVRWAVPVTLGTGESAAAQLAAIGIAAADVTHVVVSHFHGDHISALADFPHARYVFLSAGLRRLQTGSRLRRACQGYLPRLLPDDFRARAIALDDRPSIALGKEHAPLPRGYDIFGDGALVAVPLPGHADGQLGLLAHGGEGRRLFFVADAAWLMSAILADQVPPRVSGLVHANAARYAETLHQLHLFHLRHPEVGLIPSHCEATVRHWEQATRI